MEVKQKQNIGLTGIYTFTKAKIETPEQWALHNIIIERQEKGENVIPLVRELNRMCEVERWVEKNIIPTVGRTVIANNLTSSSPTNNMRINYTSVGTGTNVPANSDTQLQTETYRKQTASSTNSNNIAYATAFYAATDVNGTFTEHGLFCNGTAVANSGVLFSRVLLNGGTGITKTATETLTIDYTITIS